MDNYPKGYTEEYECKHSDKYLAKDEDGLWYCTKCEAGPEEDEPADFSGASDDPKYAPNR